MTEAEIQQHADQLYAALRKRRTIAPLTERAPDITVDHAYRISLRLLARRLESGEQVIGKKIGVTSAPVQQMLDVHQPDFGYLTDAMSYPEGGRVPISRVLIQPRAEGELAFVLGTDLIGPGVGDRDVLAATERVVPCFEIVDSRIADWRIRIQDTIADNASSGVFVLGEAASHPGELDLATCELIVEKNGRVISRGTGRTALTGSPALGSPVSCVAWLANTLGRLGVPLRAGEIILSGSLVPLEPVVPGDTMRLSVEGLGTATVAFC